MGDDSFNFEHLSLRSACCSIMTALSEMHSSNAIYYNGARRPFPLQPCQLRRTTVDECFSMSRQAGKVSFIPPHLTSPDSAISAVAPMAGRTSRGGMSVPTRCRQPCVRTVDDRNAYWTPNSRIDVRSSHDFVRLHGPDHGTRATANLVSTFYCTTCMRKPGGEDSAATPRSAASAHGSVSAAGPALDAATIAVRIRCQFVPDPNSESGPDDHRTRLGAPRQDPAASGLVLHTWPGWCYQPCCRMRGSGSRNWTCQKASKSRQLLVRPLRCHARHGTCSP
nr:hypothetical protein CFP56_52542 [Quercus suber]